tara:strand:- start:2165 stop:2662 length:498 start_codon:yes stop_codon:yes gene_type:complete
MNWKKSIRNSREKRASFRERERSVVVVARAQKTEREKMSMLPLTSSSSSSSQKKRRGRKKSIALATATAIVACIISCVFLSLFLYDIDDLEDAHEGRRTTIKTTRRPTKTSFDASFHNRRGHDDVNDEKKEKTNDAKKTFRRPYSSFPYRYVGVLKYSIFTRAKD